MANIKYRMICCCLCAVMLLAAASNCRSRPKGPDVNRPLPDSNSSILKKFIDIGEIYTYFEIAGQGTPVILIHAYSMDCRMWDAQIRELAKHYKVIRYDLRGYGRTDVPVEGEKFSHAEDLRKLMWFLGVPKAHLVGVSLGASVAVDFLTLYPAQTLSVTAVAGGIRRSPVPDYAGSALRAEIEEKERQKKIASIEAVKKQGIKEYKKQWLEMVMDLCGPHKDKIQPKLRQMINDWSAWQALHIEPPWQLDPPVTVQLKAQKPDVPVLVMMGKYDAPWSIRSGRALINALPNSRTVFLEDAGHFPNMETPQEFNKILTDFLASVETASVKRVGN